MREEKSSGDEGAAKEKEELGGGRCVTNKNLGFWH